MQPLDVFLNEGYFEMDHLVDMMRYWDWNYAKLLGYILALGAFTMALLQLINDVTPVRAVTHLLLVRRWIRTRVNLYELLNPEPAWSSDTPRVSVADALAQLIAHATGGHWLALFGLPPSQLVAQINAAAQGALENPKANYSLIAVLSQPAETRVVPLVPRDRVLERLPSHIDDLQQLLSPPSPSSAVTGDDGPMRQFMEARTRVVHRIQRNLDGLQITLGNTSSVITQILAILISVAICYFITINTRGDAQRSYLLTVLLIGISAGYIAAVLGDVVTGIRRWCRSL
jgi:hypothetical protein